MTARFAALFDSWVVEPQNRRMIRFLLNDEPIELNTPSADLTVLDWLRLHQQLTGTKEGCGSGDCGACTVVLVSASDTQSGLPLSYSPANSCILMIGALQGHQLITVDHLGTPTNLHTVQSALVEHHGSQCGFCTPGFVMSLFALFHQRIESESLAENPSYRHALIEQYLGGNLCRCTGYRPIIAAAESVLEQRFQHNARDQFDANEAKVAKQLRDFQIDVFGQLKEPGAIDSESRTAAKLVVHVPQTLTQAMRLWSSLPDAQLVAGGTDKGLEVTQQLRSWESVIHLNEVSELKNIEHYQSELLVGAGVSIAALLETLTIDFPQAVPMLLRFGSEQVRSQATVGGNLGTASPIGDLPPLLLALGADIDLVSLDDRGEGLIRRTLALSEYFVGYRETQRAENEWIHSVRIPLLSANDELRVYKISKRVDDDISSVCAAIWMQLDTQSTPANVLDVRMGFGGMAAIPKRALEAEGVLRGAHFNDASIEAACLALSKDFQPIDDARSSAHYRQQVAANLLKRFYLELNSPQELSQLSMLNTEVLA